MITTTINNWNLVSMPTDPVAPMHIDWGYEDNIASSISPFTWQRQSQQWFGADRLSGQFSMPPMTPAQARAWQVFLAELSGTLNCFRMTDPKFAQPLGEPEGAPVVDNVTAGSANNQPGQRILYVRGWQPSMFRLLLPGDRIQIGERMHIVTGAAINSDSTGKSQVAIYPGIRDALTDGQAVITHHCTGLFRLSKNKRGWSQTIPLVTVGIEFEEML